MKVKGIILFVIVLLMGQKYTSAQYAWPKEQVFTHVSEYACLTGDRLWLSIYVSTAQNPSSKSISELALVEFIDSDNNSVVRKKVLLKNGVGTCSIVVPDSLNTGLCTLMVYTNWLKNFGEESYSISRLLVFNPASYTPNSKGGKRLPANLQKAPATTEQKSIVLNADKRKYNTRESITVDILTALDFESMSVSVAPVTPNEFPKFNPVLPVSSFTKTDKLSSYPDYNGIVLSGKLVNRFDNSIIAGEEVVLSFPGATVDVDYATSDEEGNFSFLVPPAEGEKDMVFYLPHPDAVIQLKESFQNGLRNPLAKTTYHLDKNAEDFFARRFIRQQLAMKFNLNPLVEPGSVEQTTLPNFYGKAYQEVVLEDFENLDSIGEYFYELTPTVHFPIKQGKQMLYLTNPETNFTLGDNPIVFVDGVYYPDWKQLAKLDHTSLAQINVVPKTYYYGTKTYDGIVSILTHGKNFKGVELLPQMSRVIYPLSDVPEAKVPKQKHTAAHIPDLRQLLHWQNNIAGAKNEKTSISFFASDVEGDFVVRVCGITTSGKIVSTQKIISVQKQP